MHRLTLILALFFSLAGILSPLFGDTPEDRSKDISTTPINALDERVEWEPPCKYTDQPHSRGIASWYGPNFHGKRMANGAIYDMEQYTVAHKTLRLGTEVCITNRANGRSVRATVTDRGPYVGKRIIDLSKRVADELGVTAQGVAPVDIALRTQAKRV